MRILFVMRHAGYVRNFEWVLRLLAERSHRVELGFERDTADASLAERLHHETGGAISYTILPSPRDRWRPRAYELRQSVSYLRYLTPAYGEAEKLRRRWARNTPRRFVRLMSKRPMRSAALRGVVESILRTVERLVPRARVIDRFLEEGGYDLLVVTPLVDGPTQHDWLRSAKTAGIPSVLAVASWDNLTNKGALFERPGRVYVWNEAQRREAVELHRLDPESIAVVGAHSFDHWFDWNPSRPRGDFAAVTGLDPARPFVLYVCSSAFIAKDERAIVRRWIEALRADESLRDVGVLVRPHPLNAAQWEEEPLADLGSVAVWPRGGADPTDTERRADYYDSLFHSAAVLGINTTALIEAAIVGRRTFTVLLPELRAVQEETLHFHHLTHEAGGALTVAGSFDEHVHQLRQALEHPANDGWRDGFIRSFVRPHGVDRAAAPRFVDDLEQWAGDVRRA